MAKILCDIDNTLCDFYAFLMTRYGNKIKQNVLAMGGEWSAKTVKEASLEYVAAIFANGYDYDIEPYPNSVEILNSYFTNMHDIYIVTARGTEPGVDIKLRVKQLQTTKKWLDQIGLIYNSLEFTKEKVLFAINHGIGVFIDDRFSYVSQAVIATGCLGILVNSDDPTSEIGVYLGRKEEFGNTIHLVNNWLEIKDVLESHGIF